MTYFFRCPAAVLLACSLALGCAPACAAPANDDFSSATIIGGTSGSRAGTNVAATAQPGEPVHAGQPGTGSVWYRWTAPGTGRATFDTSGSAVDTVLAVYRGSAVSALTPVAVNDDLAPPADRSSRVSFAAQKGLAYFVAVDGARGTSGTFALNWRLKPYNDDFAAAQPMEGDAGSIDGDCAGGGGEPNEGNHGGVPLGASVWYTFTPSVTGHAVIDTTGSVIDTVLSVYTGDGVTSLTEIATNDDAPGDQSAKWSLVDFQAIAGVRYRVVIHGYLFSEGPLRVNWTVPGGRLADVRRDDGFTTGPDGWIVFANPGPDARATVDAGAGALLATADAATTPGRTRDIGWVTDVAARLPYNQIGPGKTVRAKFAVYATGQAPGSGGAPPPLNTIPNMRLRVAHRFAVVQLLELFHHQNPDPDGDLTGAELVPSQDPSRPSVYRVDMEPVGVPAVTGTATEGLARAFESYCLDPQDNGSLALAESSIGIYPRLPYPEETTAATVKRYDAANGDFDGPTYTLANIYANPDPTSGPTYLIDPGGVQPTGTVTPAGLTLSTVGVAGDRIGVAVADLLSGAAEDRLTRAKRVRVEEGHQYRVRFHATATVPASNNAQVRFRARTAKFAWNSQLSIGGSHGAGASSNAIARQMLPGTGCQNPDQRTPGEPGGWYTLWLRTPLDRDIRADLPAGTGLSVAMPRLYAEPGPGVEALSKRDLRLGIDLVDTIGSADGYLTEEGQVTIDTAVVQDFGVVAD